MYLLSIWQKSLQIKINSLPLGYSPLYLTSKDGLSEGPSRSGALSLHPSRSSPLHPCSLAVNGKRARHKMPYPLRIFCVLFRASRVALRRLLVPLIRFTRCPLTLLSNQMANPLYRPLVYIRHLPLVFHLHFHLFVYRYLLAQTIPILPLH